MIDIRRRAASLLILLLLGFQMLSLSFGEGSPVSAPCPVDAELSLALLDVCDSGQVFAGHTATYFWSPISISHSPVVQVVTTGFSFLVHDLPEGFPPSVYRPPRRIRSQAA